MKRFYDKNQNNVWQLKHKKKINDSWTHDGRIKIRTTYNRVVNIDTMDDLQKYMWKPV